MYENFINNTNSNRCKLDIGLLKQEEILTEYVLFVIFMILLESIIGFKGL